MNKSFLFSTMLGVLFLASSCKTEFERIRVSGDSELIYKKAEAYYADGSYERAQTLYELLIPAFRGKRELEEIYFKYAYTYYYDSKFILASYYFKNFATTFPNSSFREEAEFMSAYANYQMSPSIKLDQTPTEKAIEEFQLFINTFPSSERVTEANTLIDNCRKKLEQKAYDEAELYFNLRQYQAATLTFENLLRDFPETKNGEQVRYMMVKSCYLLAENSVLDKQLERYKQVEKYGNEFLNKYTSSSKNWKEVESMFKTSLKKIKSLENDRYQNKGTGS